MGIPWRKWNRNLHRDIGYFFFGMTLIYSISGIALNHIKQWNSNYEITRREIRLPVSELSFPITKNMAKKWLEEKQIHTRIKKIFEVPGEDEVKFYIDGGSVVFNKKTGQGVLETIKRRPLLYHLNFLHYNPQKLWTWFSDLFAVALAFLAFSGLFILKGKNGISGRGAWLTGAGILIPLILFILYI